MHVYTSTCNLTKLTVFLLTSGNPKNAVASSDDSVAQQQKENQQPPRPLPPQQLQTLPGCSGDNRPHPVAKAIALVPDKLSCRLCGESEETTYFVGCSYRQPKSKRQTCSYWVHQGCIGINFKNKKDLEKLPYFCPKHFPGKR